jgi:hypothetical protein
LRLRRENILPPAANRRKAEKLKSMLPAANFLEKV